MYARRLQLASMGGSGMRRRRAAPVRRSRAAGRGLVTYRGLTGYGARRRSRAASAPRLRRRRSMAGRGLSVYRGLQGYGSAYGATPSMGLGGARRRRRVVRRRPVGGIRRRAPVRRLARSPTLRFRSAVVRPRLMRVNRMASGRTGGAVRHKRPLSAYNRFVQRYMLAGKSMSQAAAAWRARR